MSCMHGYAPTEGCEGIFTIDFAATLLTSLKSAGIDAVLFTNTRVEPSDASFLEAARSTPRATSTAPSPSEAARSSTPPRPLMGGLRVAHLGRSSVRYELGIFRGEQLCAFGHFVHVFVDREKRRPTDIPPPLRGCLERLKVS